MLSEDLMSRVRRNRPGAIYIHYPDGHFIQAVTKQGYEAMSVALSLDDQGGYTWAKLPDAEADDAEFERIFGIVESAGLYVHLA